MTVKADWQLREARSRLSTLVDRAISDGPQRISRHGVAAVVVVSESEYNRLAQRLAENLPDFLRRLGGEGLADIDLTRDHSDRARAVDS